MEGSGGVHEDGGGWWGRGKEKVRLGEEDVVVVKEGEEVEEEEVRICGSDERRRQSLTHWRSLYVYRCVCVCVRVHSLLARTSARYAHGIISCPPP